MGLDRVGLRYINEIRVPVASDGIDWSAYINNDLLMPAQVATRGALKAVQVALHLKIDARAELLMRSGILEGHVVDGSGASGSHQLHKTALSF